MAISKVDTFMAIYHRTNINAGLNMSEIINGPGNYTVQDVFDFMKAPEVFIYKDEDYDHYVIFDREAYDYNMNNVKIGSNDYKLAFTTMIKGMIEFNDIKDNYPDRFGILADGSQGIYARYPIEQDDNRTKLGGISFQFSLDRAHRMNLFYDVNTCLVNFSFLSEVGDRDNYYSYLIQIDRRDSIYEKVVQFTGLPEMSISPVIEMYGDKEKEGNYPCLTLDIEKHLKFVSVDNYEEYDPGTEVFVIFSYFKTTNDNGRYESFMEDDGRYQSYVKDLVKWYIKNDPIWGSDTDKRWENINIEFPDLYGSSGDIYLIPGSYVTTDVLENKVGPYMSMKTIKAILADYGKNDISLRRFFRPINVEVFFVDILSNYDFNMDRRVTTFNQPDSGNQPDPNDPLEEMRYEYTFDNTMSPSEGSHYLTGKPLMFPILSISSDIDKYNIKSILRNHYRPYGNGDNSLSNDRESMFYLQLKMIFNALMRIPIDTSIGEKPSQTDKVTTDIKANLKSAGINCSSVRLGSYDNSDKYLAEVRFIFCGQNFVACSYVDLYQKVEG
jgi:hypothetical protein